MTVLQALPQHAAGATHYHFGVVLIVALLLTGLVVGALGRLVVPGRNPIGVLGTIACGLVGALVGGVIAAAVHAGLLLAIVIEVAVAALLVWLISGRRRALSRRW